MTTKSIPYQTLSNFKGTQIIYWETPKHGSKYIVKKNLKSLI